MTWDEDAGIRVAPYFRDSAGTFNAIDAGSLYLAFTTVKS
jgi:hypothetical protein